MRATDKCARNTNNEKNEEIGSNMLEILRTIV